jgi:hypothetical protein
VHASVGGDQVRVRLSTFGASALVIGAAHIALRDACAAIVPGSDRTLAFSGQPARFRKSTPKMTFSFGYNSDAQKYTLTIFRSPRITTWQTPSEPRRSFAHKLKKGATSILIHMLH